MATKNPQVRARIRAKISGTAARPRLHVMVSNQNVRAQLIDDTTSKSLGGVTTEAKKDLAGKNLTEKAVWEPAFKRLHKTWRRFWIFRVQLAFWLSAFCRIHQHIMLD